MIPTRLPQMPQRPLMGDLLYAARYYLGGRRGLWILGGVALIAGVAFNWSWLVAVGVAPLLIAALPCVAMCALGLCMNKMGGRSCEAAKSTTDAARDDPSRVALAPTAAPRLIPPANDCDDADSAPLADSEPQPLKQRRTTDA